MTVIPLTLVLIPLLLPCGAPPLARRILERLPPARALWILTASALALAASCAAALGALALTALLKLPFLATLADLIHPLSTPENLLALPVGVVATGALMVGAGTLGRSALRQFGAFRTARTQASHRPAVGDLCIVESLHPDAYALPGRPHRIVVTTAMLRSLSAAERQALFAHERAHNSAGHHYFLAAAELAAHCHPALRTLRADIRYAAERAADETAARTIGDRPLTARAIARAALAAHATARPDFAPAATTGPVPRRVTALLTPSRPCTRAAFTMAVALVATAFLSSGAATTAVIAVHHQVEVAQGEVTR